MKLLRSHSSMSDNVKKYSCPYVGCESSFHRPYKLTEHLLSHTNLKAYACTESNCEKTYTSRSHLIRHINSAHKTPENVLIYNCPRCYKKYSNRQNLKRHIKLHHEYKKEHQLTCDICDVEIRGKNSLSVHMYRHTGIKSFSCEICNNLYVTHQELKKHIRGHKTFQCNKCAANFNQWCLYQDHLRKDHIEEYICNYCGKTFKQRNHIVRHIKTHEATKTYHCMYPGCDRFYSRNSNLNQHILIKHEKVTHDCNLCPAKLCTKAKLEEHIIRLHGTPREKKPPKTRATGRKPRKDIGVVRVPIAMKIAGLPNNYSEKTNLDNHFIEYPFEVQLLNSDLEYDSPNVSMSNINETESNLNPQHYNKGSEQKFEPNIISIKSENVDC